MNTPKKHHYVPQFLLRRFAPGGSHHLFVFDKTNQRVFRSNIEDIAAENRLYEFTFLGSTGSIERSLAEFESTAAKTVDRVLCLDTVAGLLAGEREVLAELVSHLVLRSPHTTARQRDLYSKVRSTLRNRGVNPDDIKGLQDLDRNEEKLFTAITLKELTIELVPAIVEKDWMLQSAPDGHAFYISDNPVTKYNHYKTPGRGNLGLRSDGIEVFLPLSSSRCLAMRCVSLRERIVDTVVSYYLAVIKGERLPPPPPPEALKYIEDVAHGKPRLLESENVVFHNSLQVQQAERFIYAASDEFDLARLMLRDNPKLRSGPRVDVV